ncbi:hypothetical protein [Cysteiniphilum halobium]|uniref:hypothetical protein n=1 Tax=Cysteiniphilum halobium TaxID=2219059 RepID=UPI003F85F98E
MKMLTMISALLLLSFSGLYARDNDYYANHHQFQQSTHHHGEKNTKDNTKCKQ